ncbi:amidohydrolase family protein [Sphingomonas sp.]|jgi:2,3-dihydroxybenzoate decarboxylase|uniref:amidohydrolase family protein n=1 Tax=Sphingomonas sp. TaxID=28214 RepID=UPI002D7FC63F|nr:amidohydrolase family protein [Sphingomonas sp.]HEU0045413.1 amidohydrolase family protein [Sphingomonas sp.]
MEIDRRTLLAAAPLAALAHGAEAATPLRRIATEESFSIPEIASATQRFLQTDRGQKEPGFAALVAGFGREQGMRWGGQALDLGAGRIAAMAAARIDTQLLLLSAPGVQLFEAGQARELAALANERAAALCRTDPRRFAALATIAPQDPAGAARELERAVRTLGMKGALINSHTRGEYLDEPKFRPILEAAEALDVPIYIHPRDPAPGMLEPYIPQALLGPIWGFAAETGLHALRLIMGGIFDRHPRLRIVLGHLGEGLPFFIDRIDIRYAVDGSPMRVKLKERPSTYLKRNFVLTTSGMNYGPSVRQAIEVMGARNILFAADWPYEDAVAAVAAFDAIRLTAAERRMLYQTNAERVFRLTA